MCDYKNNKDGKFLKENWMRKAIIETEKDLKTYIDIFKVRLNTSKKFAWNNCDSNVILKQCFLNNSIKFFVVFSANLGDLLIKIPRPSSLYKQNSLLLNTLISFLI